MSRLDELLKELADTVFIKQDIERRRDAMTREANNLMIRHHDAEAKIARINVDLVELSREGSNGTL